MRGMGDSHTFDLKPQEVEGLQGNEILPWQKGETLVTFSFSGHRPKVSKLSSELNPSTEQTRPSTDLTLEALDPPFHSMANFESHTHEELEVKLFL